ncbi:hypothetical protein CEE36_03545 [candidate division TA06 bacterium B3_TA06]|uniref:Uncharacterized protein n=1 Tax=candidate division TA06 bacterium B3_TA06 TaxID=2012487 RepID=A0A532V899_UNCT6|nr:MAG: hypothetical protein CEE36_03545 [candidate division TA06 bacterium B3_TA06]
MSKTLKAVGLAAIAILFLMGPSLTPPISYSINLKYEIVPDQDSMPGGGVKLTWSTPYSSPGDIVSGGCKGGTVYTEEQEDWQYIITLDGVDVDTVDQQGEHYEDQVYYVYTPCATIEAWPYCDGEKYGYGEKIEFRTEEESSFEIWTVEDFNYEYSRYPSGFGFDHSGSPYDYYVSYGGYWAAIDYYVDTDFVLHAGIDHDPSLNGRESSISREEGSYDELGTLKGFNEENYQVSQQLEEGGLYGLRIEPRASGLRPAEEIHYGKLEVVAIDGEKITLKILYQYEPEFRWVVGGVPPK